MAQMEQIFPVKNNSEKPLGEKPVQIRKKSSQIINLQNKIRDQAKHISSMEEYISVLENKLKINNKEENSPEYINKLKEEKEEILSQLKQEIIMNDEQRNYIEILKQALETNIAKQMREGILHMLF